MLGSYCLPFGRRVGEYMYIFQNISLCWIYAVNNFVSICKLNIYVGVGYSSLGMIVGAFGGRVGEYTLLKIWIYAANNLGNKCCYWIYHAIFWNECS